MPSGSRPLAGSSRIRTRGSPTMAAAIASRCRIPREYVRTAVWRPGPVRSFPEPRQRAPAAFPRVADDPQVVAPGSPGCAPPDSRTAPTARGLGQIGITAGHRLSRAAVRHYKSEQHPQRGGLTGAVRAEEGGDTSRLTVNDRPRRRRTACRSWSGPDTTTARRIRAPRGWSRRVHRYRRRHVTPPAAAVAPASARPTRPRPARNRPRRP